MLYPSPLHYRQIPKLIAGTRATILLATDTFLQGYARAADPDDLASVRYVIAGAERVKDETRKLWERHGTVILEGYGATECSPVIACSLPDRNRPARSDRFLPGIEWRLEPVEGIHEGGRLSVRGPNVMRGYLDPEAPGGIDPPEDGWHDMGDIVSVDDGMVRILGRAKRFAKVGGEMISLAAIEAVAQGLWPEFNHVVVALPDPAQGRADRADHRQAGSRPRRAAGPCAGAGVSRALGAQGHPDLQHSRCWAPARPITRPRWRWRAAFSRCSSGLVTSACVPLAGTVAPPHFDIDASRMSETFREHACKNSPLFLPCRPSTTAAHAQPRPMTPGMPCGQASNWSCATARSCSAPAPTRMIAMCAI